MTDPLRVVLAPNAFKGTLTAEEAATAMAAGVHAALPTALTILRPLADGGDGSLDALEAAGFTRRPVTTRGPTGAPVAASFVVRERMAVVELASACGLSLLPGGELHPMTSSTAGVGDAIRAALDCDIDELVICVGGSASTDGGAGMLAALGVGLRDSLGEPVEACGSTLIRIAEVDMSGLDPRLTQVHITVATDVTSPLLGPGGAAAVFAPQKGATPEHVGLLEAGLAHWSQVLAQTTAVDAAMLPGAGAAGGTAFAAISVLNAEVISGAELIAEAIGLAPAISAADLVITGEGALDSQSRLGKGTGLAAGLAQQSRVPCIAVCGRVDLASEQLREMGIDDARGLTQADAVASADALQSATEAAVLQWHRRHRR